MVCLCALSIFEKAIDAPNTDIVMMIASAGCPFQSDN
jgi:hypothetical protein